VEILLDKNCKNIWEVRGGLGGVRRGGVGVVVEKGERGWNGLEVGMLGGFALWRSKVWVLGN
jgi:hypothetical protein